MYRIWYRDGLQVTLLMLNGALADFPCAVRLEEPDEILSTLFYLPPTPNVTYSAELMHRVESMFTSKEAQTPVERTLLVSGLLESCLESRVAGGKKRLTPHLGVEYDCGEASTFAQS